MKKFILATKQNMLEYFEENGRVIPATLLTVGPVTITQIKSGEKDGYEALQVGFVENKSSRVTKAERGHIKKATGKDSVFQYIREFRIAEPSEQALGDIISVSDVFKPGDKISVSGVSKGKGFQGVVKRHGFHGGPRTHGQKHSEREPGSIGATGPQRVFKGKKMAGRMGSERVTTKGLTVVAIYPDTNEIIVSGAIPGRRGTLLEVRSI